MLRRNATTKCGLGQLFSYPTNPVENTGLVAFGCKVLPVELGGFKCAGEPQGFSKVAGLGFQAAYDSRVEDFATALNPLRVGQGLTTKQEVYAQARFANKDPVTAYTEAFEPEGWQRHSIADAARRLDYDSRIVARVAQLNADRMKHSSLLPHLGPEFVTDGLMRLAMTAEKESVKLGSLIALGKVAGIDLFRETTRVERVDRTAEDVDRELKAKLQQLMAGMTIDGAAPVDVTPAKPTPSGAKLDRRRKPVAR